MDYEKYTTDERKKMLEQRVLETEKEVFRLTLEKESFEGLLTSKVGNTSQKAAEVLAEIFSALEIVTARLETAKELLSKL